MPTAPVLYLASQSPRRRQLLDQLGVPHVLLLPDADEDAEALEDLLPGELPAAYVQRVTGLKLQAARTRLQRRGLPPAPILCSDTTVALGRRILGKPVDAADARAMLSALSGRSHRVLTAVALGLPAAAVDALAPAAAAEATAPAEPLTLRALSVSRVRFAVLDAATISAYIASGEPFGKAGAYGVQSQLAGWIAHIDGSYSAIMGLPLFETAHLLRQARVSF